MKHSHVFQVQLLILLGSLVSQILLDEEETKAQVRRDRTLPNSTVIERRGDRTIITGGTQANRILFHSFREFSLPRNDVASFQIPNNSIRTIITRVTGNSRSRINGTIEALLLNGSVSTTDFFLINPNGIIFGPQAQLNLGGSFLATTAESLVFQEKIEFSATNPQVGSLLTIDIPIGLQFGSTPARISIQSRSLALDSGNTLAILGGNVDFFSARAFRPTIAAPGGRIEFGSVGADSFVGLMPTPFGWDLNYQDVQRFNDIRFEFANVNYAEDDRGGSIQLQGGDISLINSHIFADTEAVDAGEIRVSAVHLKLKQDSSIRSLSSGAGRAANLYIESDRLTLEQFSLIGSSSSGTGQTGDLYIESDRLTLRSSGQIGNLINGSGNGGDLTINVKDRIELLGGTASGNLWAPSRLFNQVMNEGDGGSILITTRLLYVVDGAQISSSTFSVGDGGNIRIEANRIEFEGAAVSDGEVVLSPRGLPYLSSIFASTREQAIGEGGTVRLITDQLRLLNGGSIQTVAFADGGAGDLIVRASEFIEVSGTDPANLLPSSLSTASGGITGVLAQGYEDATGQGGSLRIQTGELRVNDQGTLAFGSLNRDESTAQGSGTATIEADRIELSNQGRILGETASRDGGDLQIRARELLLLRQNSQISTTAGTRRRGGDGGNVSVRSNYILTALNENNDITANAYTGEGGNVSITATGIFGILPQTALTNQSDITASSRLGVDGNIEINALAIDPNRALVVLPSTFTDVQLNQRCQPGSNSPNSQFVDTARGGLPPIPENSITGSRGWADWRLPNEVSTVEQDLQTTLEDVIATAEPTAQIMEAQGWIRENSGNIILVTDAPSVTPYSSWKSPLPCQQF